MSIIDLIYNNDEYSVGVLSKMSSEYKRTFEKLCSLESEILDKFPQSSNLFREYQNIEIDLANLTNRYIFTKGFKAGACLMLEILNSK